MPNLGPAGPPPLPAVLGQIKSVLGIDGVPQVKEYSTMISLELTGLLQKNNELSYLTGVGFFRFNAATGSFVPLTLPPAVPTYETFAGLPTAFGNPSGLPEGRLVVVRGDQVGGGAPGMYYFTGEDGGQWRSLVFEATQQLGSRVDQIEQDVSAGTGGPYLGSSDNPTYAGGAQIARPANIPTDGRWTNVGWVDQAAKLANDRQESQRPPTPVVTATPGDGLVTFSFSHVAGIQSVVVKDGNTETVLAYSALVGSGATRSFSVSGSNGTAISRQVALQPAPMSTDTATDALEYRSLFSAVATAAPTTVIQPAVVDVTGPATTPEDTPATYTFGATGGGGTGSGGAVLQGQWSFAVLGAGGLPVAKTVTYDSGNRSGTIDVTWAEAGAASVAATFTPATGAAASDTQATTVTAVVLTPQAIAVAGPTSPTVGATSTYTIRDEANPGDRPFALVMRNQDGTAGAFADSPSALTVDGDGKGAAFTFAPSVATPFEFYATWTEAGGGLHEGVLEVAPQVAAVAGATDSLLDFKFDGAAGTIATLQNLGSYGGSLTTEGGAVTLDGAGYGAFPQSVRASIGSATFASELGKAFSYEFAAIYVKARLGFASGTFAMLGAQTNALGFGVSSDYNQTTVFAQSGGGRAENTTATYAVGQELEVFANVSGAESALNAFLNLYVRLAGDTAWTLVAGPQQLAGGSLDDGPFTINGSASQPLGDSYPTDYARVTLWRKNADDSAVLVSEVDALLGI